MNEAEKILHNGMTLYHGTAACFDEIHIAGHSSPSRDFGRGFYLTSFLKQDVHGRAGKRDLRASLRRVFASMKFVIFAVIIIVFLNCSNMTGIGLIF